MTELTIFDYQELTPEIREVAGQASAKIHAIESMLEQMKAIAVGQVLIEIKEVLPHGSFLPWVEHEFHWSRSATANYMRIASEFSNVTCRLHLDGLGMKSLAAIASASSKLDADEKPELLEAISTANIQKIEIDGRALTEENVKALLKDVDVLKKKNLTIEQEKKTAIANLNQQLSVAQHNIQKLQTEDKERFDATVQDRVEAEALALAKEFEQELNRLDVQNKSLERQLAELAINPSKEMKAQIASLEQAKRLNSQELEHLAKQQSELQKQISAAAAIVDQTDKNNRAVAKFHQAITGIHANHSELFGALVGTLTPSAKSQLIEAQGLLNQLISIINSAVGDRPQKVVNINSNNKTIEVEAS